MDSISGKSEEPLNQESFIGLLHTGSSWSIENATQEKVDLLSEIFPSSSKSDPKEVFFLVSRSFLAVSILFIVTFILIVRIFLFLLNSCSHNSGKG